MTDKRIKMFLIAGAFVLTLGVGSVALNGIEDTVTFFTTVVGLAGDAKK